MKLLEMRCNLPDFLHELWPRATGRHGRFQLLSYLPTALSTANEMPRERYSLPPDITVENPFSKQEAWIFVIVYSSCVVFLVCMYEYLMPVFNNPTYPYYNFVPDYSFKPPLIT
ncbi:hypothetical protein RB195_025583 [Necator americanus]|uniref:PIG-P domain-containing protein n=1 Tax=Necator americanus TaxID=51031 RepID=A0ABR1ESY6_NECAM